MSNSFNGATAKRAPTVARQPAKRHTVAKTARGLLTTAQHTMTVVGLSAVAVVALMYARPEMARDISQLISHDAASPDQASPPALSERTPAAAPASAIVAAPKPLSADEKALLGSKKQQQFVTSWLSRKYRVAGDAANMLVSTAYVTAHEIKLDPLLILAVMAIESGLNPFAESPVGAQGLMQVMSKIHHDKFQKLGGVEAALNPVANIRVGSLILKDYVTRGGSVEAGLKTYVGAAAFANDDGYGFRVLAEYSRLKQVATGKNVPTMTMPAPTVAVKAPPAVHHDDQLAPSVREDQVAGL